MNDQMEEVVVPDDPIGRRARMSIPRASSAVILFVHGGATGGRTSLRDGYVADRMHGLGLATVQTDLLTSDEASSLPPAREVALLVDRIRLVTTFVALHPATVGRPLAYFGAGTGSAAALLAAVTNGGSVAAVVCRGGPLELAAARVAEVDVPTLLLVGEGDAAERASALLETMRCERRLEVIPGATDLFDDQASLDQVADRASGWILAHLPRA